MPRARYVCILCKWINCFADKIRLLAEAKNFLLNESALNAFDLLKADLSNTALQSIDELLPLVIECDTSDIAVSATLNEGSGPAMYMSPTL